jgi:pimeloyl-ACP methyl ester carboxylesterase
VSAWHFTAAPGVDHITEMARLGHTSVSLHLLGYRSSDPVDGFTLCYAAYADQVQQVIDHLRAGSYTMAGRSGPAFEQVALAGHSLGGLYAELATVSFHGADALIVQGWTDYLWMGTLPAGVDEGVDSAHPFPYRAAAGFAHRCVTAPESKQPGGPGGWAYIFTTRAEFELLVHDIDPDVLEASSKLYEQDPCGTLDSTPAALAANISLAPTVDVPVLLANGDRDPLAAPTQIELQRARYELGSDDVSSLIVPATAHMVMLERTAPVFRAGLSSWLKARGF